MGSFCFLVIIHSVIETYQNYRVVELERDRAEPLIIWMHS